ncbi:MAG: hypothetical protein ACK4GN_14925 [Runella sp.]
MKKFLLAGLLLGLMAFDGLAQRASRLRNFTEVGAGFQDKRGMGVLQFNQYLQIERRGVLQVGWGGRGAFFSARDADFITAPARLTRGQSGFAALNAPLLLRNIDTLQMPRATFTSFNFSLQIQISLFERLDIGVNTDLLGFTLGSRRTGFYLGSRGFSFVDSLNVHRTYQTAVPTRGNLQILGGDNAHGSLNSEIYARLMLSQRVALKVSHIFNTSEYRTDKRLADDNRRFRLRSPMWYVALCIPIYN